MYDIITIGSATRDVFLQSKGIVTIRSSRFNTGAAECLPFGSKIAIDKIDFTVGGSGANTAVTFAKRGFHVAIVAKVGDDIRGEEIVRSLKDEGVATNFVARDKEHETAYSVILLAQSGERSILTYRGAESEMKPSDLPLTKLHAKWFYITHLGGRSAPLFPKILKHAGPTGAKVAVNPGKTQLSMPIKKLQPLLNMIDVFILNREEASELTKIPYHEQDKIFRKLDQWVRGLVVMTDGPGGVTVSDGTTRWHVGKLRERRIIDRTGAGDAFGSGFVAGLVEKKGNVPYAIQLGSANATSNIEIVGAQTGLLKKRDSIYRWGKLKIQKIEIRK